MLCQCGCGETTNAVTMADKRLSLKVGDFYRFKSGHSSRLRSCRAYPRSGSIYIHRQRAEKALGRPLPEGCHVHHADGSKNPKAPLVICQDAAYHDLLEIRTKALRRGGDPNTQRWCQRCQSLRAITCFGKSSRMLDKLSRTCRNCQKAQSLKSYALYKTRHGARNILANPARCGA